MNNLQIKYFLAVCSNKSFSKTAKELYISQPSLSKHIANLEKELGLDLFDRTVKLTTKLTPSGELFYDFFSKYINELNDTIRKASLLGNEQSGTVRICCIKEWDLSNLVRNVQAFNTRYPYIDVSFECSGFKGLERGLDYDHFDLVIGTSVAFQGNENVNIEKIADVSNIVLFSSKHHLAQKEKLDILDFKEDILYVISSEETPLGKDINESICKSKGFIPRIKLMNNTESILLALSSGRGYTIMDYWSRIKDTPSFSYFKIDTFNTVSMVWKKTNINPALNVFLKECSFAL